MIAQIAKRRFNVPTVIARILDPYRAEWYEQQGMRTVCPTRVAIEMLETEVTEAASRAGGPESRGRGMYVIVVGAGKVGWNLGRELLEKGHEVTLIEKDRDRYLAVEQELEHNVQYGDASELWVLERAGIARADMVIAVTGDDEDNMLICQVAKEKYMVEQVIARVNNPRNKQWFELLGISPVVSATDLILRLIEHEVPKYGLVHLLDLPQERLEIIELLLSETSPVTGQRVGGPGAAGGEPADLGAARRDRVRARAGDGAGGRGRGARRPRSGPRGGAEGLLRPRRRGRLSDRGGDAPRVDYLLIGGFAAAHCAAELRQRGAEGSILLVGREPHPPYERPPLSKEYLRGESTRGGRIRQPGRTGTRRTASSC